MNIIEGENEKCMFSKLKIQFISLQLQDKDMISLIESELVKYGYTVER